MIWEPQLTNYTTTPLQSINRDLVYPEDLGRLRSVAALKDSSCQII